MDNKRHDTEKLKPSDSSAPADSSDSTKADDSAKADDSTTTVYSAKTRETPTPAVTSAAVTSANTTSANTTGANTTGANATNATPVVDSARVETPSTVVTSSPVPANAAMPMNASANANASANIAANAVNDEPVAAHYITRELSHARKSLRNTQIFGSLLVLGTLGYMSYIAYNFRESLQPQAAAEIAGSIINQRVQEQATGLADQVKQRVPGLIAGLPDYALKQMPQYRQALETRIASDLETHCKKAAVDLDTHIDGFLAENKDKIKSVLGDSQNPEAVRELGGALQHEFLKSLKQINAGGNETVGVKIDKSLQALREINTKMKRLADNRNLSPQEKKARHALAIMVGTVNRETKGVQMPTKISFDTSR